MYVEKRKKEKQENTYAFLKDLEKRADLRPLCSYDAEASELGMGFWKKRVQYLFKELILSPNSSAWLKGGSTS